LSAENAILNMEKVTKMGLNNDNYFWLIFTYSFGKIGDFLETAMVRYFLH
jgi:hypothetical protein